MSPACLPRAALLLATLVLLAVLCADTQAEPGTEVSVPACCYWVETGLRVEKGRAYRVEPVDFSTVNDWGLEVRDLEGWPPGVLRVLATPIFWTRRRACEPWFAVIATVDRRHPVRLRADRAYVAPATGKLVCYFNDAPFAYWNNHGTARLRLTKKALRSTGGQSGPQVKRR